MHWLTQGFPEISSTQFCKKLHMPISGLPPSIDITFSEVFLKLNLYRSHNEWFWKNSKIFVLENSAKICCASKLDSPHLFQFLHPECTLIPFCMGRLSKKYYIWQIERKNYVFAHIQISLRRDSYLCVHLAISARI